MAIDQAWNDDGVARIDFLRTGSVQIRPNRRDLAAFDQHIAFRKIADLGVHGDDRAAPEHDAMLLVHAWEGGKTVHILRLRLNKHQVKVTLVSPGFIETEMLESVYYGGSYPNSPHPACNPQKPLGQATGISSSFYPRLQPLP